MCHVTFRRILLIVVFVVGASYGHSPAETGFAQDREEPIHVYSGSAPPAVWSASTERQVESLLSQMTLEEKIGQTVLYTSFWGLTGPSAQTAELEESIRQARCGNVFNARTVEYIQKLQKIAVEETRLGIPLLFGLDVIHGHKTIFPISLGEAASWDLEAIERSARVAAVEATACGVNWTFAPMVDIARDPRWGRISEGAGEDPYLGCQVARARVRGFQGADLTDPGTLLACVKHFAAYGAAQAGRDYHTVDMSERALRETYLPPFRAAIDEGALSVMTSFNELNGTPATANRFLLTEILREEWGFPGFVVTDYTSINEMVSHGSAADEMQAGVQAIMAGVDMDMQGGVFDTCLKQAVEEGTVARARVDEAVRRILCVKAALGLFDDPYRYCDAEREKRRSGAPAHHEAAYDVACKSMVLLKNERQTLPLPPNRRLAVIGPLADSRRDLLGSWCAAGEADSIASVLTSLQQAGTAKDIVFAKGCEIDSDDRSGFANAVQVAQAADIVVMVLGESWEMSGEAASRTTIRLPGVQTELLRAVAEVGKPVVLVLMNGRPLALTEESELASAILEAWYPGTEGGKAIADVLFGVRSPSGKLPVTFPRNLGQVPIYHSMKNTGRPIDLVDPEQKYKSRYLDCPNEPLYPFGFGLSYATFRYADLTLNRPSLAAGERLTISVTVTNTGDCVGSEVVQLYIQDLVGSVTRPVRELKAFRKIELRPGEARTVTFAIGERELSFLRHDMTWGAEAGEFRAFVGPNSRDALSVAFALAE